MLSACGSDNDNPGNSPFPTDDDAGGSAEDAGNVLGYDEAGRPIIGYDEAGAPIYGELLTPSDAAVRTLTVEPLDPTLSVNGEAKTLSFSALLDGNALPKASWTMDNPMLGSIDESGVFHSAGRVAGSAKITARYATYEATTTIHVVASITHVDSEPGSNGMPGTPKVTDAQKGALDGPATGMDDAGNPFRWFYPYDNTVFPRGLAAPELMFGGTASDAMQVTLKVGNDFEFKGYFAGRARPGITLPAEVWDALTKSADGMSAVDVEVKKLSGSTVVGPIKQKWRVAPGDLKGIIYYNSYNSPQANNSGAVMRIKPGENAGVLLQVDNCTVCHSVSAEGNVLAAGVQWTGGTGTGNDRNNPRDSRSWDLKEDGTASPRYSATNTDGRAFPFGGLTPDGKWLLGSGVPSQSPIRGLSGTLESKLYDTQTGEVVAAPSLTDVVKFALTPAFSPDAKRVAFSWYGNGTRNSKDIAVADVDLSVSPPAFSTPTVVASAQITWDADDGGFAKGLGVVGWPSFFPDGKGLVYQDGQRFDTNRHGGKSSFGELALVEVESKAVNRLSAMNGWLSAGSTYLPHGAAEESRMNYEPAVLPVPVGGYYWVIFTSRRAYGNSIAPGGSVARGDDEWGVPPSGTAELPSPRKKLWVAAIDIDYAGKVDPSHPAFYLPGQELEAGNMRAYTSLPPCRDVGGDCSSGADCCGGFCRWEQSGDVGEAKPVCVPPPVGCSNVDETCKVDADCCGAAMGDKCINGRCAAPNVFLF